MADINSLLVAASESGDTAKISSLSKELNEWELEIEKLFTQLEKSTEDFEFESAKYETLLKELGDDDSDS
ncbi:MAG: hypothetical protein LRY50_06880 [Geovibrio sp.]|nr:hypothetical protein [Geovibrio sp.]